LDGIDRVALSFDVMTPEQKAVLTTKLRGGVSERTPGISLDAKTRVLAVASGKGGVGKSSLTANLAAAFSNLGHRTGVLDADIYGYSIPHMLGVHQRPVAVDKMIVPPVRGDLKVMSIGFFLDENTPVMWRGPMLHRALEQFLSDVHWGELDTLVVDMPPGTGDVAISLGQLLPRAEAIVVTTPHSAAQQVAVRAAQMARKTNMRLVGVVENMSYLVGSREELFGSGGGQALSDEVGAPLLGRIPFDPRLAAYADAGEPIVDAEPESEVSQAIVELAQAIADTRREQGVGIVKSLPLVSA
jgi:ATP-binding protein involved in chromosome partitioning